MILLRDDRAITDELEPCTCGDPSCVCWLVTPSPHHFAQCMAQGIREGRLYRLRDEQKTDEQTRTRELERTR